jgi:predicted nucleotidyltransferase component of viral defense system
MSEERYRKQVRLLLQVIPVVAQESCFALHGGTAINLFVRDMPRVSVDIDLTYIPLEDRETTLSNIAKALDSIRLKLQKNDSSLQVEHKQDIAKLLINNREAVIKLEVNHVGRGVIGETLKRSLCMKAQEEFDVFCAIPVVPLGQLFGGKICAALDRQHPRDLFDVKWLLENEGITDEIKKAVIYSFLGSDRPNNEIIKPNFHDHRRAMEQQFVGMTDEAFDYQAFEATRELLVSTLNDSFTDQDKVFLINFENLTPDWSLYNFEKFPSVRWKLQNLRKLQRSNPKKHKEQMDALKAKLGF